MIRVSIKTERFTYTRDLPESWQDLTPKSRLRLFRIVCKVQGNLVSMAALNYLLSLPRGMLAMIPSHQLEQMLEVLSWLKVDQDPVPIVDSFEHRGVHYYLPKAKFDNGKAIEYPVADEFFTKFMASGDEQSLLNLVATICRPADPNADETDIRIPFKNRAEVLVRAKTMRHLSVEKRFLVLLYFSGVKAYVYNLYKKWLFEAPEEDDDVDQDLDEAPEEKLPVRKTDGPDFGWWGSYLDVASSGVFGDYEKVLHTRFHTICTWLIKKRIEADEMEERYAASRINHNG
ncbi:MAG: hypothetical protein ABI002_14595 [Saprospiraceae bacterium]